MQTKLDSATNSQTVLTDSLKELNETMAEYSEGNKKENIVDNNNNKVFSYSDLQVLYDLINIETVNDDYFSDELSLYEHYTQIMTEKVKPKTQFTTKTGNMYKYVYLNNNILKLGLWYELDKKLKEVFNEERIRLISYEYYPNKGKEGSFENLVYSSKVTSINMFKKQNKNTSVISKTNQMVSKVATETTKLSNTITEKIGNNSLIDYKDNTALELNNKLSSTDFNTRFYNRQANFDFTMGSNLTKVKIDKDSINVNNGQFKLINEDGITVVNSLFNMPKLYESGTKSITLEIGETEKTFLIERIHNPNIFDYAVIIYDNQEEIKSTLPYYRTNKSYTMDEGIIINLFIKAFINNDGNMYILKVTVSRPDNYKDVAETFELEWTTCIK